MKNLFSFILLFTLAITGHAAKIGDDNLIIGKPGSAADKEINLGSEVIIRNNKTTGKAEFSEDSGLNFKRFGTGSGSGGGENFNNGFGTDDNANAESGTDGWTNSGGGTFTTTTTDPLEGDASFTFTASAQNDYVQGPLLSVDKDIFRARSCQASIEYIGGDENLKLRIIDGGGNLYREAEFDLPAHVTSATESVFFLCPSATDIAGNSDLGNLRLRISNSGASAAPLIKFDKSYLGTLVGLTTTTIDGSAHHVGSVKWDSATNCLWGNSTNSFSRYGTDPDCDNNPRTIIGNVDEGSAGQRPEIIINNIKTTGFYKVTYSGALYKPTGTNSCRYRLVGDTTSNIIDAGSVDFMRWSNMQWTVQFTSNPGSSKELQLEVLSTDSANCHIDVRTVNLKIDVDYFPSEEDAQKTFQIYKSTPKTSQVKNVFKTAFDASQAQNPVVISSESVPGAFTCNRNAAGVHVCDLSGLGLTVVPHITCSISQNESGVGSRGCVIRNKTTTSFQLDVNNFSANAFEDRDFDVTVTKQGADYKTETVQPVIVGQVKSSYAETALTTMRVETCRISNSGTPAGDSAYCDSWIDSYTKVSNGRMYISTLPGIFTKKAVCTCRSLDTSDIVCGRNGNDIAADEATIIDYYFGTTDLNPILNIDSDIELTCIGE